MIEDSHAVIVKATPITVYKHIEEREAKFPIYPFLDSRPFIALRLILIGESRSGLKMLLYGYKYFRDIRAKKKYLWEIIMVLSSSWKLLRARNTGSNLKLG
jgi:hypothetical protein